jgi:hypothetical protein
VFKTGVKNLACGKRASQRPGDSRALPSRHSMTMVGGIYAIRGSGPLVN